MKRPSHGWLTVHNVLLRAESAAASAIAAASAWSSVRGADAATTPRLSQSDATIWRRTVKAPGRTFLGGSAVDGAHRRICRSGYDSKGICADPLERTVGREAGQHEAGEGSAAGATRPCLVSIVIRAPIAVQ